MQFHKVPIHNNSFSLVLGSKLLLSLQISHKSFHTLKVEFLKSAFLFISQAADAMFSNHQSDSQSEPDRGHRKLDGQTGFPKTIKRHFFQDNQVSF